MLFKVKPSFRDVVLGTVAVISLIGLLGLSFIDINIREDFSKMALLTIGAVIGYFTPGQK